jgi:Flp pilus assembly secretin CpaC
MGVGLRFFGACALAALAAAPATAAPAGASGAGAPGGPPPLTVMIDHAKVVKLPERTQTVIVGNPIIADVTVQRNGIMVVTGKSYGVTNLIALDGAGTLLSESLISVQAPTESLVTVQRGLERESYSCTPNCQPSLLLGDANKYFGEVGGQATQRNTFATGR